MSRYIDADALPKLFNTQYKATRKLIDEGETHLDNLAEGFTEATQVIRFIAPTVDVAPVVHGHWKFVTHHLFEDYKRCSICGNVTGDYVVNKQTFHHDYPYYCPNCGAQMDGVEE